jgi:hypothetical protein
LVAAVGDTLPASVGQDRFVYANFLESVGPLAAEHVLRWLGPGASPADRIAALDVAAALLPNGAHEIAERAAALLQRGDVGVAVAAAKWLGTVAAVCERPPIDVIVGALSARVNSGARGPVRDAIAGAAARCVTAKAVAESGQCFRGAVEVLVKCMPVDEPSEVRAVLHGLAAAEEVICGDVEGMKTFLAIAAPVIADLELTQGDTMALLSCAQAIERIFAGLDDGWERIRQALANKPARIAAFMKNHKQAVEYLERLREQAPMPEAGAEPMELTN